MNLKNIMLSKKQPDSKSIFRCRIALTGTSTTVKTAVKEVRTVLAVHVEVSGLMETSCPISRGGAA